MTSDLAKHLEHTLRQLNSIGGDVDRTCCEAVRHQNQAVCVLPYYVTITRKLFSGNQVLVTIVVAFPFVYTFTNGFLVLVNSS